MTIRRKRSIEVKVKVGDKIYIEWMDGEPQYAGRTGIVKHIDDMGQIHGTWGGCALIPGQDSYRLLPNEGE